MKTAYKNDKIQEALGLLNEAAQEKKQEIYEKLGDRYSQIRELLLDQVENGEEIVNRAKKQIARTFHAEEAKLRSRAKEIGKTVHRNPWPFLGAAVLGSLAVGVALGKK